MNYASLSAFNQTRVDNVNFNIMSVSRHARSASTPDQLDRWTDAANGDRIDVVTGRTRFVDRSNNGAASGTSVLPFKTVAAGVAAASASGSDIVLLRPGNYNEPMTITKPLCISRATRGSASIGLP
jgi:hypothetical protein